MKTNKSKTQGEEHFALLQDSSLEDSFGTGVCSVIAFSLSRSGDDGTLSKAPDVVPKPFLLSSICSDSLVAFGLFGENLLLLEKASLTVFNTSKEKGVGINKRAREYASIDEEEFCSFAVDEKSRVFIAA